MKATVLAGMIALTLLLALATAAGGLGYVLPYPGVRELAYWYLTTALNPGNPLFSAMSPEAVTSIVWDYRGLDTLFETAVFFLAIIGSMALMRKISLKAPEDIRMPSFGMSPIVKTVTRVTVGMILAVAASIALHGHLTPGGGFQGGAAAAVAPLIIIVVFSIYFALRSGITKKSMLALRTLGLTGVGLTAFITAVIGLFAGVTAFVFQNQPKEVAPVGLPYEVGGFPVSGTLILFNFFEFLAVAAGFTIVFLLLSVPERVVNQELLEGGEGNEH